MVQRNCIRAAQLRSRLHAILSVYEAYLVKWPIEKGTHELKLSEDEDPRKDQTILKITLTTPELSNSIIGANLIACELGQEQNKAEIYSLTD